MRKLVKIKLWVVCATMIKKRVKQLVNLYAMNKWISSIFSRRIKANKRGALYLCTQHCFQTSAVTKQKIFAMGRTIWEIKSLWEGEFAALPLSWYQQSPSGFCLGVGSRRKWECQGRTAPGGGIIASLSPAMPLMDPLGMGATKSACSTGMGLLAPCPIKCLVIC